MINKQKKKKKEKKENKSKRKDWKKILLLGLITTSRHTGRPRFIDCMEAGNWGAPRPARVKQPSWAVDAHPFIPRLLLFGMPGRSLGREKPFSAGMYNNDLSVVHPSGVSEVRHWQEKCVLKQVFLSGQNRERNSDCLLFCVWWRWDWFVYANACHLSPLASLVSNNVMVESLLKMFVFLKGWYVFNF